MESFVNPQQNNKRIRKRKVSSPQSSENENPDLGFETVTQSISKAESYARKKLIPSSENPFFDNDEDLQTTSSTQSSEERKDFPSSVWTYKDLQFLNVNCEDKAISFEEFVKEVKDCFMTYTPKFNCPDVTQIISDSIKFMKENLTFSCDLGQLSEPYPWDLKEDIIKAVLEELNANYDKISSRNSNPPDENLNRFQVFSGLKCYTELLNATGELIRKDMTIKIKRKPILLKTRKRQRRTIEKDDTFLDYCQKFLDIYFLRKGCFDSRSLFYRNKTAESHPDLTYPFYKHDWKKKLFFIIEVKRNPDNTNGAEESLKEQVGLRTIGRIGSELLIESEDSAFFPNSLGMICIETKLIFMFLKRSKEHFLSIINEKKSIAGEGKIIYTRPFDMLNTEDRVKMAELLFWLGCMQDPTLCNKLI